MAFVALKHLKWGDEWIAPGEPVPDEEGRNYASLLRTKRIAKVPDAAEMNDAEFAVAYEKATEELDTARKRVVELEEGSDSDVEVPEDVTPGETLGWPIDAVSGGALALTDEQREELEKEGLSGEAIVTHEGYIVAIETETEPAKEIPGQTDVNATEAAVRLAAEHEIDLGTVEGSGNDGRIEKPDVQKAIDAAAA
jgi:pyruvate/2-oxoglutarate dehydrogenase complex dihydrolipoamide acyltransferase (E2) component